MRTFWMQSMKELKNSAVKSPKLKLWLKQLKMLSTFLLNRTSRFNKRDRRNSPKSRSKRDTLKPSQRKSTLKPISKTSETDCNTSMKMKQQQMTRRNSLLANHHFSTSLMLPRSHKSLKRLLISLTPLEPVSSTQRHSLHKLLSHPTLRPNQVKSWNCSNLELHHQVSKISNFQSQDNKTKLMKNSKQSLKKRSRKESKIKLVLLMNSIQLPFHWLMDHSNKNLLLQWTMLLPWSDQDKDNPLSKSC